MLGRKGTDIITGFSGVITGYTQYLSGCNQVLLIPPLDKDGKLVEGNWFDVQRVKLADEPGLQLINASRPGFDRPAPVNPVH